MFRNNLQKYLALLVIAMTALPVCGCEDNNANAAAPEATRAAVRYSAIAPLDIPLVQELPGRVAAQTVAEVRPQVGGIIQRRLFEEGTDVKAGQALYQIDPQVYQAAYNSALAGLKQAEANETSARLLAERYSVLVKTAAVSRQEHDDALASSLQSAAAVEVAKSTLETARINLDYTKVTSPVDGRIGRSFVTEGALVTAGQATLLATVQQLDPVYVDLTLSSTQLLRMRKSFSGGEYVGDGQSPVLARLRLEDGSLYARLQKPGESESEAITGSLLFSEVNVEQSTGTVTLRVKISNPDKILLPGMYVHAELEGGLAKGAITVPQKAVQRDSRGVFTAYVLIPGAGEDYRVEQRVLAIERNYGNNWVVSSGVKAGELLLVDGLQKVRAGQMVSAVAVENRQRSALVQAR